MHMKLLLIYPRFTVSFWSFRWIFDHVLKEQESLCPPLGLATLAGLTSSDWDITIIDENIEEIDWDFDADIVGVGGMREQYGRQREILNEFRKRGRYVVAGGAFASLMPERYSDIADTVISGEAEYIWPEFCSDFVAGSPKRLYRETGEVNLSDSPVPRYDLLKMKQYLYATLQFSRGCPYRCEFCDIIVMYGRKPRVKNFQQIERELDVLRGQGLNDIFFVDDNFIGDRPKCKEFLAFLAAYQKRNKCKLSLGTQASINLASDNNLLSLFRTANFSWLFIGVESPSKEALLETKKEQNTRQDLLESIRIIYSHNIDVMFGMIIGFDSDDQSIFEAQYQFLNQAGAIISMVGLLNAVERTPLFERLEKANRLNQDKYDTNVTTSSLYTNIIPLKMSYQEMVEAYVGFLSHFFEDALIYQRIRKKFKYLQSASIYTKTDGQLCELKMVWRLIHSSVIGHGVKRWHYFLRCIVLSHGSLSRLRAILKNWVAAMSLRSFVAEAIRVREETQRPIETAKNRPESELRLPAWENSMQTTLPSVYKHGASLD